MELTSEISAGEFAALTVVLLDPVDWHENAVRARVAAALAEIRQDAGWPQMVAAAAAAGVPESDGSAIVQHALLAGTLKTAAQREAERIAAIPPPPPAPTAPGSVTDRQFAQALAKQGVIAKDEALAWTASGTLPPMLQAAIDTIPDEEDRFDAKMFASGATTFERNHPTTLLLAGALAPALEWEPDEIQARLDELWTFAATL